MRLFLAPLLLALLVGCNQDRNESIRLMNKGIMAFKANKLSAAVDLLGQATLKDPKNHRAFYYRGLVEYQKLGEMGKGEASIRSAIQVKGDEADYHYHLGHIQTAKKDWQAAVSAFEQSIKLREAHAESHIRLGQCLERLEKYDRAQEEYHRAVKIDPRMPEGYNALGNLYLRFEKFSQAVQVFKNGIENNPQFARNYADLGVAYQALKRFDDAIKQFKLALQLDPGDAGVLFNMGMAYYNTDDRAAALQNLKSYLSRKSSVEDEVRIRVAQSMIARLEAGSAPE